MTVLHTKTNIRISNKWCRGSLDDPNLFWVCIRWENETIFRYNRNGKVHYVQYKPYHNGNRCTLCQWWSGLDSAYVALSNPDRRCPKDHKIHIYQSVYEHIQNVSARTFIYLRGIVDCIHKGILWQIRFVYLLCIWPRIGECHDYSS